MAIMLYFYRRGLLLALLAAAGVGGAGAFRFRAQQDCGGGGTPLIWENNNQNQSPCYVPAGYTILIRGGGGVSDDKSDDEDSAIDAKVVSAGVVAVALSILAQQISSRLASRFGRSRREAAAAAGPQPPAAVPEEPPAPIVEEPQISVRTIVIAEKPPAVAPAEKPDTSIVSKTAVSVVLTSLALMAVLYCANLPDVTKFYHSLGLPNKVFGVSPVLYAAFLFLTFASSVVTDVVVGGVSADVVTRPTSTPSSEWYANVKKPSWNPPGWLFPIMWLAISKPTQFLALRQMFLVPLSTDKTTATMTLVSQPDWLALAVYCTHLALGNAWNDVFFRYHDIALGLKVISIFWVTLALSSVLFFQTTPWAGFLLLPTLAWVTVATTLNWSIDNLNKDKDSKK